MKVLKLAYWILIVAQILRLFTTLSTLSNYYYFRDSAFALRLYYGILSIWLLTCLYSAAIGYCLNVFHEKPWQVKLSYGCAAWSFLCTLIPIGFPAVSNYLNGYPNLVHIELLPYIIMAIGWLFIQSKAIFPIMKRLVITYLIYLSLSVWLEILTRVNHDYTYTIIGWFLGLIPPIFTFQLIRAAIRRKREEEQIVLDITSIQATT